MQKKRGGFSLPLPPLMFNLDDSFRIIKLVLIESFIGVDKFYGRGSGSIGSENLIKSTL